MTKLMKTKDYFLFKFTNNRPISEIKVSHLMEEIRSADFSQEFPIVVNSKMQIMDGQHRFEALKKLGKPIYYIQSDTLDVENVAKINKTVKRWSYDDFCHYYASMGNESYKWILKKSTEWGLSVQILLRIIGQHHRDILAGRFEISPQIMSRTIKVYEHLKEFYSVFPSGWKQRNFVIAVRKMMTTSGYDESIMKRKFEYMGQSFKKQVSTDAYIEMLENIYNHRNTTTKLRINRDAQ